MAHNLTAQPGEWPRGDLDWLRQPQTRPILIYLFMWTVIAVVATTTTFIALAGTSIGQWFSMLRIMTSFFYAWAGIALLIYWMVTRLRLSLRTGPWVILGHIALLIVVSVSLAYVVNGDNWQEFLNGPRAAAFHALNAFIYSFVLIGSLLLRYYRDGRVREREAQFQSLRASRLENDLNRAKIDTLKMQINPHFLFNALNSIAALIETTRNCEAYRMTELLGGLLRSALDQSSEKTISLKDELQFLTQYIEIEKIRFGGKLAFECAVPDDCLDRLIPTLLLQPIVENAIKHAVTPSPHKVTIVLTVQCDAAALHISICDDGPGLSEPSRAGHGLSNVRQRLQLLYGDAARIAIRNNDPKGAVVSVDLPAPAAVNSTG